MIDIKTASSAPFHNTRRESIQVIIASLEFAANGNGELKLLCQREAASINFGTSAILRACMNMAFGTTARLHAYASCQQGRNRT